MIKTVTYTLNTGESVSVEYDADAPCRLCGEPVVDASMGGIDICPWCDCGVDREGKKRPMEFFLRKEFREQYGIPLRDVNAT